MNKKSNAAGALGEGARNYAPKCPFLPKNGAKKD
jgi:hypothetical protein